MTFNISYLPKDFLSPSGKWRNCTRLQKLHGFINVCRKINYYILLQKSPGLYCAEKISIQLIWRNKKILKIIHYLLSLFRSNIVEWKGIHITKYLTKYQNTFIFMWQFLAHDLVNLIQTFYIILCVGWRKRFVYKYKYSRQIEVQLSKIPNQN